MSVVEALTELVSTRWLLSLILSATLLSSILSRLNRHRRIKKLGNYAVPLNSCWIPYGLDIICKGIRFGKANKNLELWRDHFFQRGKFTTAEAEIAGERVVFTIDPENVNAVLATQFSDFGKGKLFHDEWKEFLGDGIFATDGATWLNSRQLLRPQFSRDRMAHLECFESHMGTLFKAMANGSALLGDHQQVNMANVNGKVLDIADLFYRYTLDVATDFLLGADVKSMSTPKQEFAEAFNNVQRWHINAARAGKLCKFIPKTKCRADLRIINNFVGRFIDLTLGMSPTELACTGRSEKGHTFLHQLARFTRDRTVIRDQLIAVLLAGRDTTAATLSWIIYELARHPDCLAKLRREILDIVGPVRAPTTEHMKNMPYLRAVIHEVLRLYPAIPYNIRIALKDCTLPRGGGADGSEPLPVLKDDRVAYSPLVMQRRPDLYPPVSETFADPAIFSPDRWAHWQPKPHEFVPFNSGPRICMGQQFALTQMSFVLARLFQRFDRIESRMFELDQGIPTLQTDVVLSPGMGVHVAFWEADDAQQGARQ